MQILLIAAEVALALPTIDYCIAQLLLIVVTIVINYKEFPLYFDRPTPHLLLHHFHCCCFFFLNIIVALNLVNNTKCIHCSVQTRLADSFVYKACSSC